MNLIDYINTADLKLMSDYIKYYAPKEEDEADLYTQADITYILREWADKKQDLFTLFGNKLILEKKVVFQRSYDEAISELEEYFDRTYDNPSSFSSFIHALSQIQWNTDFSTYNEGHSMKCLYDLTRSSNLVYKIYDGEEFTLTSFDGTKTITIPSGIKRTKALRKVANLYDIEGFEEFNLEYSRFMNQENLSGNLVLSIHPFDYMTMSHNNCDWDSCMLWPDVGEYRQGTIEMMNSPCVIVAYLTSSASFTPLDFDDRTWYNKKWRQLFIVNNDIITGIKSYPYLNNSITKEVLNWLRELAVANWGADLEDSTIYYSPNTTFPHPKDEGRQIRISFDTDIMYNDFRDSQEYEAYISSKIQSSYSLCYSGSSECVWCGELNPSLGGDNSLLCSQCGGYTVCCCCGTDIRYTEAYNFHEKFYCSECYYEHIAKCALCGKENYIDEMTTIYLMGYEDKKHKCKIYMHEPRYVDRHCLKNWEEFTKNTPFKGRQIYHDVILGDVMQEIYYVYADLEDPDAQDLFDLYDVPLSDSLWHWVGVEVSHNLVPFTPAAEVNPISL